MPAQTYSWDEVPFAECLHPDQMIMCQVGNTPKSRLLDSIGREDFRTRLIVCIAVARGMLAQTHYTVDALFWGVCSPGLYELVPV